MNSPVSELKPTCVRWTGSYGVEISTLRLLLLLPPPVLEKTSAAKRWRGESVPLGPSATRRERGRQTPTHRRSSRTLCSSCPPCPSLQRSRRPRCRYPGPRSSAARFLRSPRRSPLPASHARLRRCPPAYPACRARRRPSPPSAQRRSPRRCPSADRRPTPTRGPGSPSAARRRASTGWSPPSSPGRSGASSSARSSGSARVATLPPPRTTRAGRGRRRC